MKYIAIILVSLFLVSNASAKPRKADCKTVEKWLSKALTTAAEIIEAEEWDEFPDRGRRIHPEIAIIYTAVCK